MTIFRNLGYLENVADILSRLCTCFGALPQGGATSPALSNLACGDLDRKLGNFTHHRNLIYTRYADDMTFSAKRKSTFVGVFPEIETILKSEKFRLNPAKTRFKGPGEQCRVTGLIKNSAYPAFGIGRKQKIKMRAVMHHVILHKDRSDHYRDVDSINGWLNYVKGVDRNSYHQMFRYWNGLKEKYLP